MTTAINIWMYNLICIYILNGFILCILFLKSLPFLHNYESSKMLIIEKPENIDNHKKHQNHSVNSLTKKQPLKSNFSESDVWKAHKVATCL